MADRREEAKVRLPARLRECAMVGADGGGAIVSAFSEYSHSMDRRAARPACVSIRSWKPSRSSQRSTVQPPAKLITASALVCREAE